MNKKPHAVQIIATGNVSTEILKVLCKETDVPTHAVFAARGDQILEGDTFKEVVSYREVFFDPAKLTNKLMWSNEGKAFDALGHNIVSNANPFANIVICDANHDFSIATSLSVCRKLLKSNKPVVLAVMYSEGSNRLSASSVRALARFHYQASAMGKFLPVVSYSKQVFSYQRWAVRDLLNLSKLAISPSKSGDAALSHLCLLGKETAIKPTLIELTKWTPKSQRLPANKLALTAVKDYRYSLSNVEPLTTCELNAKTKSFLPAYVGTVSLEVHCDVADTNVSIVQRGVCKDAQYQRHQGFVKRNVRDIGKIDYGKVGFVVKSVSPLVIEHSETAKKKAPTTFVLTPNDMQPNETISKLIGGLSAGQSLFVTLDEKGNPTPAV